MILTFVVAILAIFAIFAIPWLLLREKRSDDNDAVKDPKYFHKETIEEKIDRKLKFLHSELPRKLISINGIFFLPEYLHQEIIGSNFSQSSLQKLSDHIGHFLGLLSSVKVTIGIESSDNMMVSPDELNKANHVGLYKIVDGFNREIQLTKKFRFELKHILAILAHESTHNFLYHHGIVESDESENEYLTDISAAYVGLGGLLLDGYQPIYWTSDHWQSSNGKGYTEHKISIGYLKPKEVCHAIARSAEMRKIEELALSLPYRWRHAVLSRLEKIRKREAKKKTQVESLGSKLEKLKLLYEKIKVLITKPSESNVKYKTSAKTAKTLVDISNKIFTDDIAMSINDYLKNIELLRNSENINEKEIKHLSLEIAQLSKTLSSWQKLLRKSIIQKN